MTLESSVRAGPVSLSFISIPPSAQNSGWLPLKGPYKKVLKEGRNAFPPKVDAEKLCSSPLPGLSYFAGNLHVYLTHFGFMIVTTYFSLHTPWLRESHTGLPQAWLGKDCGDLTPQLLAQTPTEQPSMSVFTELAICL